MSKKYRKHNKLTIEQKDNIIHMFHALQDNTDKNVADTLGFPLHLVSGYISRYLEKKAKSMQKKSNSYPYK